MATADATDIIANWPVEEGTSLSETYERAPAWNEFVTARNNAACRRDLAGATFWSRAAEDALTRCGNWIHALMENGDLVLEAFRSERLGEKPVRFSKLVVGLLSFDWSGETVRGPNGEVFYGPRIYAAATMASKPAPLSRTEIVGTVVVRPEQSPRRKTDHKRPLNALTKCTDYIVTVLQDSPGHKTMTANELKAKCKKFKVSDRDYIQARKNAFARVPEAEAAWTAPGRS
jgi:hypothetical protein